jgi:hypothetical protein
VGTRLFRQTWACAWSTGPNRPAPTAHHLGQIELVREFFSSATLSAISDLPFIFIFVAMTFMSAGPLGWVLVVGIPLIMLVAWLIQGSMRRATSANMQQTGRPARRAGGGGGRAGGPQGGRRAGPLSAALRARPLQPRPRARCAPAPHQLDDEHLVDDRSRPSPW